MAWQVHNLAAHEFFISNGWVYKFCILMTAENGPGGWGQPDADLYHHQDGETVVIDWRGAETWQDYAWQDDAWPAAAGDDDVTPNG